MTNTTSDDTSPTPSSTDQLLRRILERLDRLEDKVNGVALVAEHAQAAIVDTVDDRVRALQAQGVDVDARIAAAGPLLERLTAPETSRALTGLLDRLDAVEHAVTLAEHAPNTIAALTDTVDGLIATAQANGVDIDARARALFTLVERASTPEVTGALCTLTKELPRLATVVEALPNGIATAMDTFDDFVAGLSARGVDVESLLENMVTVATRVSNVLESPEFTALMNTGVLAPRTLEVIGKAGEALAATQQADVPRVGLFGAVKAAGHPDMQKLLGFALTFAQHFGRQLDGQSAKGALPARSS